MARRLLVKVSIPRLVRQKSNNRLFVLSLDPIAPDSQATAVKPAGIAVGHM